jgi:hypothetical protein
VPLKQMQPLCASFAVPSWHHGLSMSIVKSLPPLCFMMWCITAHPAFPWCLYWLEKQGAYRSSPVTSLFAYLKHFNSFSKGKWTVKAQDCRDIPPVQCGIVCFAKGSQYPAQIARFPTGVCGVFCTFHKVAFSSVQPARFLFHDLDGKSPGIPR